MSRQRRAAARSAARPTRRFPRQSRWTRRSSPAADRTARPLWRQSPRLSASPARAEFHWNTSALRAIVPRSPAPARASFRVACPHVHHPHSAPNRKLSQLRAARTRLPCQLCPRLRPPRRLRENALSQSELHARALRLPPDAGKFETPSRPFGAAALPARSIEEFQKVTDGVVDRKIPLLPGSPG